MEATSTASAVGLIGDPDVRGGAIGGIPGMEGGGIDGGGGTPKLGLVAVCWSWDMMEANPGVLVERIGGGGGGGVVAGGAASLPLFRIQIPMR